MSELMTPIPFRQLMTWITTEYAGEGSVFGVTAPSIPAARPCPRPYSFASILQAHHAFTYSSKACGTVSSVDHSQL